MNFPILRKWISTALLVLTFAASLWHVFLRPLRSKTDSPAEVEIYIGHWFLNVSVREAFDRAIAEYERLNPHVHVHQALVPVRSYATWTRAQFVGGTATDITGILRMSEETISRYYLPLSPWLDAPNPYNRGTHLENIPWRDTFVDGLAAVRGLTPTFGEIYGVMLQGNALRLYYNRDMLREVTGSSAPPSNVRELFEVAQQLSDYNTRTGRRITPVAASGPYARWGFNVILASQTQKMVLTHSPNRNLRVTPIELAAMLLDGTLSYATPELRSYLTLMSEVSKILSPGFMQLQRDEAIGAFLQQTSLMLIANVGDFAAFSQEGGFDLSAVPLPLPETSDPRFGEYTLGLTAEGGGAEAMLGIIRYSGHREVALDFLHYISSYRPAAEFSRISQGLSAIIDVPVPFDEEQLGPRYVGEMPGFVADFGWWSADHASNFFQRHAHEIMGAMSSEENVAAFAEKLDEGLGRYLREDIAAQLRHIRRSLRRLDAAVVMHYGLPSGHVAQRAWTGYSEAQHMSQLENISYSGYTDLP